MSTQLSSQPVDFAIAECSADNGEGCGQIFPRKTTPGLCAGCHAIDVLHKDNPSEQDRYRVRVLNPSFSMPSSVSDSFRKCLNAHHAVSSAEIFHSQLIKPLYVENVQVCCY
jgi:hypothetical protein